MKSVYRSEKTFGVYLPIFLNFWSLSDPGENFFKVPKNYFPKNVPHQSSYWYISVEAWKKVNGWFKEGLIVNQEN